MEDGNERDYAIHLLKAQMEEGGILDVTSGRRYDLEAALSKGLVDEMTVLKLLDLQSDEEGSVVGDEEAAMSVLKQAVSDGFISSNVALCLMEKQSLLRSGHTISISESSESAEHVGLNVDSKANIYPEENCPHFTSDYHSLGLINNNEAENTYQSTERKVAVMVLDLTDEEADNKEMESEDGDTELDSETTGNVETMSNYLHHFPRSVGGRESLMISPSSWSQATDKSSLLAEDGDSQGVINSQLTDEDDVFRVVIENAAPSPQLGLSNRTSGASADPESQSQYTTSAFLSKSGGSPFDDEFFIAGYDAEVGDQMEVMETLNTALGDDSQEERRHILESIKEESSEGEDDDLGQQLSPQLPANSDACKVEQVKNKLFSIQDYLECVGRLQDHADALDDVRKDLLIQPPTGNSMEDLQIQVEECQLKVGQERGEIGKGRRLEPMTAAEDSASSLESQLSRLAGFLTADMEKAKQLLNSPGEGIPKQIHQDLASTYLELEPNFTAVSQMCAERSRSLIQALETGKDTQSNLLKEARLKLEDVTFDIQCFISEHAQFLSPAQSSYLLKFLSTTQRAFRDQSERLVTQRSTLDVLLDTREREDREKSRQHEPP
ncbi:uncharacterized protein ABDE67_013959 [Symphorus nematophorus]